MYPRFLAAGAFLVLLAILWLVARHFGVAAQAPPLVWLSAALLVAPYWAFGFGFRPLLTTPVARVFGGCLLLIPYLAGGQFRLNIFAGLLSVILMVCALLEWGGDIGPWVVLAILALAVETHIFDRAWVAPGLTALPKLLMVDLGLYGFLVVHPIGGIGYDFRPHGRDFGIGLREFFLYTPIALSLGLATAFLHVHATLTSPWHFAAGWIFTLFFIAVPEELFFRGLLLNLLERKIGTRYAVAVSSVLFGLAHFNKRTAYFNWRYVILAAIAGVFYARAWLDRRRVLTSSATHATVDTVWSIWLR